MSAHAGVVEPSRPGSGGPRAAWSRLRATDRRGLTRRLLLPVLIGWPMAADLRDSPVRLAAAALVVAAVTARVARPALALLLASACLSVAPAAALVAVVVLAYGAAYRTSSPYRAGAVFAAAWVLVALSALHRITDPGGPDALALAATAGVACLAAPAAVGAWAGARARRLMDLRERNEILQQANLLGESRAKMAERARIAGEMHDLIGHRLSLISLHAGALELGTRADAPRLSEQAVLIRTTAKQALDELREVLGILNADAGGGRADDPDPEAGDHAEVGTRADVDALVQASRKAGTPVELHWIGEDLTGLDSPLRRAVHRLVREALTNVHKHAPGMATRVTVEHQAETVIVEIDNRLPAPTAATGTTTPRSGLGLIGLHERVRLVGGTLTRGPGVDRFVVRALLPIAARPGHSPGQAPESGDPSGRRKKASA